MMQEIRQKPETPEVNAPEKPGFTEIRPETGLSPDQARDYVDRLFQDPRDTQDGYYNSLEDRLAHCPLDGLRGQWTPTRGESRFIPSDETDAGRAARDRLVEKGMDGIEYKNCEPDFSRCAEATVTIDNMTEYRYGNFCQADEKCAEQWNDSRRDGRSDWQASEVRDWRHENDLTWHERSDTRTMDLVSYDIHSYFGHSGGCSECRLRDAGDSGGFDE